jgi:hypothetical protein
MVVSRIINVIERQANAFPIVNMLFLKSVIVEIALAALKVAAAAVHVPPRVITVVALRVMKITVMGNVVVRRSALVSHALPSRRLLFRYPKCRTAAALP